ncbi:hypothetical protein Syun_013783 [Stephania yunnanensis]|uniref:Uncharacterized protein n=1 Tax=Stephania yunnanensis TaxID=152371 RepID=A0AAP0P816_9MAGN
MGDGVGVEMADLETLEEALKREEVLLLLIEREGVVPYLAEREAVEEADRKSGWSVVMDDGDGSVGGRWLAPAVTGHATTMVSD